MIRRRDETGTALISVLVLLMVVLAFAQVAFVHATTMARDAQLDRGELLATYAAEAGLAKAKVALRADPEFSGCVFEIGREKVSVTVTVTRAEGGCTIRARAAAWPAGRRGPKVAVTRVCRFGG